MERKVEMIGDGGIRKGKIRKFERSIWWIVARYSPRGNGIGVIVDRSLAEPLSPLNMAVYRESLFKNIGRERKTTIPSATLSIDRSRYESRYDRTKSESREDRLLAINQEHA